MKDMPTAYPRINTKRLCNDTAQPNRVTLGFSNARVRTNPVRNSVRMRPI